MEEFKGDKRTKAYKIWKAEFEAKQAEQSKGLGDTVEKITEATGIKKVVKAVLGDDCGCDERKAKLNKLVTYKVVNCLEEDEYTYLNRFFAKRRHNIGRVDKIALKQLITIYNRVFNKRQQMTNCSSCVKNIIEQLEKLINNY
jgi:hypothetical protein